LAPYIAHLLLYKYSCLKCSSHQTIHNIVVMWTWSDLQPQYVDSVKPKKVNKLLQ
jgi:hypothetical protein